MPYPLMFDARVRAVLGPTNTGKTHLAITRLLAHSSGIIGFPLRLLARENYDRMVAAKGEKHVALITGEEKIIPPDAKWFACTVEAMPLDRRAEFVAVDEIQLCADPDRGHVFTDRLLHARGLVETMFLGAETIRPLLQRLVPQAEIETRPRLSQLTHAGVTKLVRLPPRSAVVAFSAGEVYAIAEAIRRRRGGCAVVMGRLSPRTRNAQVKLYQDREVDFLVATDAIGMGLNMDVDHVAFASLNKFDGHAGRGLTAQEAAQIAGRAGRGMRDGTFGATGDCPPLPDKMVDDIEKHNFEALQTLAWRNSDLDFANVDALLDSLAASPALPGLSKGHDATDHITLSMLAREAETRALAGSRNRVRLLWDACSVPDFRKLADDTHTRICGRIFKHLAEDGALPEAWVAEQIGYCANIEGDLDTLMARLANIRVWSYVAARADWLRDAPRFQEEARSAEDKVSDALHERLTARFVDRRAAHLMRRLDDTEEDLLSAVTRQGEVVVEGHPVGRIDGFQFAPEASAATEDERRLVLRAARRALREEMPRRVAALEMAKDDAFALTPLHGIAWTHTGAGAADVARLRRGPEPAKPLVEVLASEFLDGAQRERVRARLAKYVDALITRDLGAIAAVEAKAEAEGALRGPAFLLRESLGIAPGGTEGSITSDLRQKLKAIGVRAGRFALFLPEALKPRAMALRAQIWALAGDIPTPGLPAPGLVALAIRPPAVEARTGGSGAVAAATRATASTVTGAPETGATEVEASRLEVSEVGAPEVGAPETGASETDTTGTRVPETGAIAAAPARPPVAAPARSPPAAPANLPVWATWPPGFAEAMGWLPAGPVLLRLDVAERIAAELGFLTRRAPAAPPADLASRLGVKADTLGVTLAALGFRLLEPPPLDEGMYGPPTPLLVAQPRPSHHQARRDPRGAKPAHDRPAHDRPEANRGEANRGEEGRAGRGGARRERPDRNQPGRDRRPDGTGPGPVEAGAPAVVAGPSEASPGAAAEAAPHEYRRGGRPSQPGAPRGREARAGDAAEGRQRPRGSGPPQGQPYRGRDSRPDGAPSPARPPPEPRINPDSPFAILAQLKLR